MPPLRCNDAQQVTCYTQQVVWSFACSLMAATGVGIPGEHAPVLNDCTMGGIAVTHTTVQSYDWC